MKKISKRKQLLTKSSLGVVGASLVMTPIITAVACGTDNVKPTPIPNKTVAWSEINPALKIQNTFIGTFSTPEKLAEFMAITDKIPKDAFKNEIGLNSITLPGVKVIGENAFAMDDPDNNNLTSVNLPNAEEIKNNAFHNTKVEIIDFPNVTKLGTNLFNQERLHSISLPKITTLEDNTFKDVTLLTYLSLPKVVTIKNDVFLNVASSTIVNFNFPALEMIGSNLFRYLDVKMLTAPKLISVGSSAFELSGFEDMSTLSLPDLVNVGLGAFGVASFTIIDLPKLVSSSVGAFESSPIQTLKILLANIDNIANESFNNIQATAIVTVADKTLWEGNARLEDIFGPNFNQITFINA